MSGLSRWFRGPATGSPFEPFVRALPALLYMAAIFAASSVPGDRIGLRFDDRVAHFLEYFVLGVLLVFFAVSLRGGSGTGASALILAFAALHAAVDEIHQGFVPRRDSSLKDWLFDVAGAATAVAVLRLAARRGER